MDSRKIDDSHKRWENQTDFAQKVWAEYEESTVPNIVNNALIKGSSFKSLYQKLAIARARCEFEKKPEGDRFEIIYKGTFGAMGCSGVPCVDSIEKWGSLATNLVKERTLNRYGDIGLSNYSGNRIEHPMKCDLEIESFLIKIHPYHHQITTTKNFFQFIKLSARMMFDLSNIPPIIRGSAATNSQYFDKIAKRNFNINYNLRPLLYDWVAYFETQEQYIGYYVVLASIQYLQTIPSFEKYKKFFEDAIIDMLKNPIIIENSRKRNEIWETIQKYILNVLKGPSKLNPEQIENLQSIVSGKLIFRLPSEGIIKFVDMIKEKDPYVPVQDKFVLYKCHLTRRQLTKIIKTSGCNLKDLQRILYLHTHTFEQYLNCYGDPAAEEAMNKDWADLEILRTLDFGDCAFYVSSLKKILFPEKITNTKIRGLTRSGYNVVSISRDPCTIMPEVLLDLVKHKPSYVKFLKKIYFVETDGKARLIQLGDYHQVSFFYVTPDKLSEIFLSLFPAFQDIPQPLEGELSKIIAYDRTSLRFSKMIDTLRQCSLASWDTIAKLSIETVTILATDYSKDDSKCQLKERLLEAIWSGGIVLQDLIGLTLEQICILTDSNALALYKTNTFICAKDILPSAEFKFSETPKDSPQEEKKIEMISDKLTLYQKTLKLFSHLHPKENKNLDNKPRIHAWCLQKWGPADN